MTAAGGVLAGVPLLVSANLTNSGDSPLGSIIVLLDAAEQLLLEEGYAYDSSLFPVAQHPSYGYPGAQRDPHWL